MMQHVQNLGKIKKSTNLVPEYNPKKIDKVSFMMSLRITLWRSMPLKFRLNTAKRKNKIVQVNQIKKAIKIFCRPSRMRITNCFIIYVSGWGAGRYCNTEKGYRKKIIVKKNYLHYKHV